MRVGILGATEVRAPDGATVAVPGVRARALLAMLALDAGRIVGTGRLLDGVYGEDVPNNAANALQSQVSRLRQALRAAGLGDAVEFHPGGYRLALDRDEVDAHLFSRLVEQGRAALAGNDPGTAAALLEEAEALWRGPALADAAFVAATSGLAQARLDATEDRIAARLRVHDPATLVPELRELVAAHPLRERLHSQLVRALHAAGRGAEALTAFETARRVLAEELGANPSAELTAAHLAVLRDETPQSAPLPAQFTSFVGRDDELKNLGELLTQARLVTLTGPGGTGKTRLAIEAAGGYGGETCFVELAPLTDPADVGQATLAALGLREVTMPMRGTERSTASTVERLVTALADRPVLLVLDNCEHLVDAVARLAGALLAGCPSVRILATSREPLDITGETLLPVPRLRAAPEGTALADAPGYPAVRLFVDRATAGRPDFALDNETLRHVLHICAELDGLPLAIELAAARVRNLLVDTVAARLDDRFSLLSKGSRTAADRHRTLRAVVEWSWGLLDDAERELARRLTVFAGGATIEAAEAVYRRPDTVDVLAGLADKSFVERDGDRFRMLQTIHAFCAERLAEAGEAGATRRAHAEYLLRLADRAGRHLIGSDQLGWLALLAAEHDNLHAALRWAIEHDAALALRLLSALVPYWWMSGRRSEGAQLAADLADTLGDEPPDGLAEEFAVCVLDAAFAERPSARLAGQQAAAGRVVLGLTEVPGQRFLIVLHAVVTGPPTMDQELEARLNQMLDLDPWTTALVPMGSGMLELYRGELSTADTLLNQALRQFRELGERWGLSMVLGALGQTEARRGNCAVALELIDEALGLAGELGATMEIADLYAQRAEAHAFAGEPDAARADYQRSAEIAARAGSAEKSAVARLGLAELALRRGEAAQAKDLALRAVPAASPARFELADARLRAWYVLSRIATADGEHAEALALLRRMVHTSCAEGNPLYLSVALDGLAEQALDSGDAVRAARMYGAARGAYRAALPNDTELRAFADRLRTQLGEQRYQREEAVGRALDFAGIRELAGPPTG